jgi:hypothetical protein
MRVVGLLLLMFTMSLVPASVRAASVDDIIAMSKAGVSEPVILAYIARDKTIFTIDSDLLVKLKTAGVSENVVLAMLKSGRSEADAALKADEAARVENYMASSTVGPSSINIGHGPQRPNAEPDFFPLGAPPQVYSPDFSPVPYAVPYGAPYGSAAYGSAFVPVVVPPFAAPSRRVRRRPAAPTPALNRAVCLPPMTSAAALAACSPPPAKRRVR